MCHIACHVATFVDKLTIHVFVNNSDEPLMLQRMYVIRMIVRYDIKLRVKRKKNQYFFSICEYIYSDNSSILIDTLSNVYKSINGTLDIKSIMSRQWMYLIRMKSKMQFHCVL